MHLIVDISLLVVKCAFRIRFNWALIEKKGRKSILTDFIDVVIIEIPKIYKLKGNENEDKLLEWIYFLDNPNSEVVDKIMEKNNGVKEAKEKLEDMSNDVIMQRLAEWQESAEHDEASVKAMARRKGIQEERLEIAKKMKKEGLELELIMKITQLSKEEIENIN